MIELKKVNFKYKQGQNDKVLHNINFTIKQGEVVLLCGESGCGKTTLTRLINGLIPNYYEGILEGEVFINEKAVSKLPLYEIARKVGSVFQNPRSQFFKVDTTSELAFGCENMGLPPDKIEKRIKDSVVNFNLQELMGKNIFHLSGGEKQKIACAYVSASKPDIFVLDEPSSNLDMAAIEDLREVIGHWKGNGKTIVIAEHRLHYLRELADWVVYLKEGRIEKIISMEQMKKMSLWEIQKMGLRPLYLEGLGRNEDNVCLNDSSLKLSDFSLSYNKKQVMKVGMQKLPKGEIVAVVGHNGSGKTSFARCLCGLEKKCNGTMEINGTIYKRKERLKKCYMVMQDVNHQLFTESVIDEVLLSMETPDEEIAEKILKDLNLLSFKDSHPMSLSGGQKQRVAIASAIASKKDIIIFDEPSSGLDLRHMREVSASLKKLQQMGKTIFVITHDLELILESCTHILHFDKGKIVDNYSLDDKGELKLKSFFNSKDYWVNDEVYIDFM
jgi:energy-coupling factor transport system ATP-binding protein